MSTEAQISANQANAQLSTGPKTEAGKSASSQNSWKHGLAVGVFRVLATEDQFMYDNGLDTARLNLFLRYENQQERAFHKCLADLLKLRAEKQKAEIGFASHTRKQEMHAFDLLFRQAEIDHEQVRMSSVKCDIYCQERRLEAALERENRAEQAQIDRENRAEQAFQAEKAA
jgi:hypothetical protein